MSLKTDEMSKGPTLDDSLVYIPIEDVPDGLLNKLPDFKVIVKDKQGDRILPKERLGEVLESMNRDESRLPRHTTGGEMSQLNQLKSSKAFDRECNPAALNHPLFNSCPRLSPERHIFTESKESTPRKYDFSYDGEFGSDIVATSPVHLQFYNNHTIQRVSMPLKEETHHRELYSSPSTKFDSYSCAANHSYCPKKPVKILHRRLPRTDIGDVSRARKRLFSLGECMKENDRDSLSDQYCYPDMCSRRVEREIDVFARDQKCLQAQDCGIKRKYYLSEREAENSHWSSPKYSRTTTEIAAEHRLHDSLPVRREHRDYYDGEPSHHLTNDARCTCSLVKSNLLQMTKSAYRNIQRQNCTPESFEEFRKELKEINSVLQESVNVLYAVEKLCCHE